MKFFISLNGLPGHPVYFIALNYSLFRLQQLPQLPICCQSYFQPSTCLNQTSTPVQSKYDLPPLYKCTYMIEPSWRIQTKSSTWLETLTTRLNQTSSWFSLLAADWTLISSSPRPSSRSSHPSACPETAP